MSHARMFFAIVLLLGCGADDGNDTGAGTTSASTGTESTTTATTTTMGSSTTQVTTSTTTTSDGESSSSTATTASDASSSSEASSTAPSEESSGGGGVCAEDPEDDACRECVKATCCDDWAACQADEVCACIIDCHLGGSSLGQCNNQCGGDSEVYQALYFCGQMTCLGTCDWDCC